MDVYKWMERKPDNTQQGRMEIFVDIKNFEGYYKVSNLGRVYSIKTNKFLKLKRRNNNYLIAQLSKDGKQYPIFAHRLVAMMFCERPEHLKDIPFEDLDVDHINTVRDDNRAENLRWCTRSENNLNPITRQRQVDSHKGENHNNWGKHLSDTTKEKIGEAHRGEKCTFWGKFGKHSITSKPVIQYSISGEFIRCWDSAADAHRQGVANYSKISMCCNGKRPSAGGYRWKFKEDA